MDILSLKYQAHIKAPKREKVDEAITKDLFFL